MSNIALGITPTENISWGGGNPNSVSGTPSSITDGNLNSRRFLQRIGGMSSYTSAVYTIDFPSEMKITEVRLKWYTTVPSDGSTSAFLDYIQVYKEGSWETIQTRINRKSNSPTTTTVTELHDKVTSVRWRQYASSSGSFINGSAIAMYEMEVEGEVSAEPSPIYYFDGSNSYSFVKDENSALKIRTSSSQTGGIELCETTDTDASPIRIMTGSGVKSLKKY